MLLTLQNHTKITELFKKKKKAMALSLTIINSNPCRDLLVLYCNQIWHDVRSWRPKNWFLNWHTIQIQK